MRFLKQGDLFYRLVIHMKIRTYKKPVLPSEKIEKIIKNLRKVYAFLIVLGVLSASFFFIDSAVGDTTTKTQHKEGLINLLLYISIYFGLRKRSHWVVHLILICSAFALFVISIDILSPAESIEMLVTKIVNVILLFFFIYQINFFRRNEVKTFFSTSGVEFYQ